MKRALCLAAVVAVLLAFTSCAREPTLQEIFESQYGNAYIYENGEHGFMFSRGHATALKTSHTGDIDNSLPYKLVPAALQYDLREGKINQTMWLIYRIENNSDDGLTVYDDEATVEQRIDGAWYWCATLNTASNFSKQFIPAGGSGEFMRSLAFTHFDYEKQDTNPDRYINFPAGRYRVVHEVGWQKYVSLEFDLVYEGGMCYLHVVEDE